MKKKIMKMMFAAILLSTQFIPVAYAEETSYSDIQLEDEAAEMYEGEGEDEVDDTEETSEALTEDETTEGEMTAESEVTVTSEETKEVVPYENVYYSDVFSSEQGRSELYDYFGYVQIAPRVEAYSSSNVNATDTNTPSKDFIDVSSHNGLITVDSYKKMKALGVKGVVVKLTEYTTYTNPYAESQVKNAQAAGLIVSVYHYSWFTSDKEAIAEANYFAQAAKRLGLPSSTIMVNDMEEPKIKGTTNHTTTSQTFAKRLKELGYTTVHHYSSRSWFDEKYMDASVLGYNNIWVAAYPYTITKQQLNTQYSAWQWTSKVSFTGISSLFDMSSDYGGLYTKTTTTTTPASYYTTNPGYVMMLKDDYIYQNTSFSKVGSKTTKGTVHKVTGIEYTSGGTPRLKVNGGYLTANKNYVVKVLSNHANYYTKVEASGYIYTKTNDRSYKDVNFTTKNKTYAKNSILKVVGIVVSDANCPRLLLSDGSYYTANKTKVGWLNASYANYYLSNSNVSYVYFKKADYYYSSLSFTGATMGSQIKAGTILKVTGVEYTASGVPRLKTNKGYVTANKKYVAKITGSYSKYYTDVSKVKLLKDDYVYSGVDFTSGNRVQLLKKGQVVTITGIDFTASGTPRLKVKGGGYLTANKSYVSKQ